MRTRMQVLLPAIFLSAALLSQERPTPFNPDSAAAYLRTLSIDIGPRPMGSPGEQEAMRFAIRKYQEFGLDQAYVLPFQVAPSGRLPGANTKSGTAVGVLRGKTERIIVIGGHIDSYSPEGPGTNDDGSGSSVVIELARVMALREWESTIVFCLFGGEESGLKGSAHFAGAFADMDKVALMLQVDMANGTDWLIPFMDISTHSSPQWLVRAAYEELESLGHTGLRYPTHFFSLNAAIGGAGSDHEPFLRKDIPAIDFTTDVRDPIHTPQDSYEFFKLGGLERSGDLVYRLVERFDAGTPEERMGRYMMIQIGTVPYFLPFWFLWLFITLSVAVAGYAVRTLRPHRTERRGEERPKIPGIKTLLLTLFVVLLAWLSEDVVSLFAGLRTPWYGDPSAMLPVGFATALLGIWFASRFTSKMNLSKDLYRYALPSFVILFSLILLAGVFTGPRLAMYPAVGLFFLSLAALTKRGWLGIALILCGVYPTTRLIFSEVHDFLARSFAQIPAGGGEYVVTIILTIFCALNLMPYARVFLGILRASDRTWPAFPIPLTHPAIGGVILLAIVGFSVRVISGPAYTPEWTRKIEVTQEVSVTGGDMRTTVRSSEYLEGASITFMALDTVIAGHETSVVLPTLPLNASTWLSSDIQTPDGGMGSLVSIRSWTRPYTLEVRYTTKGGADRSNIVDASAGLTSVSLNDGVAVITYYSFPDTLLTIPVTLTLSKPDTVYQTVVATFVEEAVPVSVTMENSSVIYRTIVTETKEFFVGKTE